MLEFVIVVVVATMIALGFYLSVHKATEAKLIAEFAAVRSALGPILSMITSHGVSLNDIEGVLGLHGLSLATLEDKAKNVLTDIEKSKAIQEIEAAVEKAKALLTEATPAVADPLAPSAATKPATAIPVTP